MGETEGEFTKSLADWASAKFPELVKSGHLVVISPPQYYYPDFHAKIEKIRARLTIYNFFDDPEDRIKWRVKQNLDYAYLWDWVDGKSKYFLQLEVRVSHISLHLKIDFRQNYNPCSLASVFN